MMIAGLRHAWRDGDALQIGADPVGATLVAGLGTGARDVLALLDGTRTGSDVRAAAQAAGMRAQAVEALLASLAAAGVLDDADARPPVGDARDALARRRLGPDIDAWTARSDAAGAGWALLARRRAAHVRVVGAGRVGASLAALLAAAGVGRVSIDDPSPVSVTDAAPGGIAVALVADGDAGGEPDAPARDGPAPRTRAAAARAAVRRAAPEARVRGDGLAPDLVVLTESLAGVPPAADALVAAGTAHLSARVLDNRGIVGPVVRPGLTACLRCIELARTDRDPLRPHVVAQLDRVRAVPPPCDVVLASATATLAAAQALAWVDAPHLVDPRARTVEIALPALSPRARSWTAHPLCGCRELPE